jgi:outer membrane usher protein
MQAQPPQGAIHTDRGSAFLNWGVEYTDAYRGVFSGSLEGGGYSKDAEATVQGSVRVGQGEGPVVNRVSVSRDHPDMTRQVVGDVSVTRGTITGYARHRDFRINPYFSPWPEVDAEGVLPTAGTVTVRADGRLYQSRSLEPGPFVFRNLPLPYGASTLSVVTVPKDGYPVSTARRVYRSASLLKPGLADFSYALGLERKDMGQESFSYADPAFAGYYRLGITPQLTLGASASRLRNDTAAGVDLVAVPWSLGEVKVSAVAGGEQSGGRASYEYIFGAGGFGASVGRIDGDTQADIWAGAYHPVLGGLRAEYRHHSGRTRKSLSYSKNMGFGLSLYATGETGDDTRVFAGLSWYLGGGYNAFMGYQDSGPTSRLSKSLPLGPGTGFSLRTWESDGDRGVEGDVTVNTRYARLSAGALSFDGVDRKAASISGSLVLADGLHASRPVTQFLLVKVGDIPRVPVTVNGTLRGTTDRNGELIVPDVPPYYESRVTIDTEAIPMEYEIERREVTVVPSLRGGTVVTFPVRKAIAVAGVLLFKGKPAEMYDMDVAKQKTLTGTDGSFYLEGVSPGDHKARIYSGEDDCSFMLRIPDKAGITDLGTIRCEKE